MVRKYIVDSVKYWADEYHIDGFRFDLVGLIDTKTINQIVNEVHKTDPEVIFYGEGWNMQTAVEPSDTPMATQGNARETPEFAYFSDTFRDFIKGKDESDWGFVQNADRYDWRGADNNTYLIECFTADSWWLKNQNPTQVINYASCHDNYTLKDKINITSQNASEAERIKMNNLAAAMYLTAEGIPLIHAGEEMLRTKVDTDGTVIHNSYNWPDYINSLKWGDLNAQSYQDVRDYYKGLIAFRKNHASLRLATDAEVKKVVSSTGIANNVVLFKVKGKGTVANEVADEIAIIFNATKSAQTVSIGSGTWQVCVNDQKAGTDVLATVTNGQVSVPAISAMVLVKGEMVDRNSVYINAAVSPETPKPYPEKVIGTVVVKYVDEAGTEIATSETKTGTVEEAYTTEAKAITGYTLITTPANASGKFAESAITVTYVYKKNVDESVEEKVEEMKGFEVTKVKDYSVTLKWTKNDSAAGYEIQQYKGGKWVTIKKIQTNEKVSYKVKGLKASTSYKFRIRGYKGNLYSAYEIVKTTTLPSEVSGFKASKKTATTITLKWKKNASAKGYVIEQKKNGKWKVIKKITKKSTVSYKVKKLKKATKYQFRIKAYKGKLYSGYSTISVKTSK